MPKILRATAAWRISIWTALAFAVGTGLAFSIVYLIVSRGMTERSDAWLSGEAQVLARVSADTPPDRLYKRIVGEVAELATRELPDERNAEGQRLNSVFFLEEMPNSADAPLWVGPGSVDVFRKAIQATEFTPGVPQTLNIEGRPTQFRIVAQRESGTTVYLGLSTRGAAYVLHSLTRRFLLLWSGTALIGFLISYMSAYRTLSRVERITETVGRIGSEDLTERLPEPPNSDEISRLAKTFNRMLDRIQSSVTELRMVTDTVAHDLKSPITSIRGTLESALSSDENANWRESVCEAIEGLDKLLNLLNTSLDVAEAQAGALSLNLNSVDLSSVVRQVADLYQPALSDRAHKLTMEVENHVVVDADEILMYRVLSNLLENEIAHLPDGCHITVRLISHDKLAELTVEDNGPGFPAEITGRAFERFVKGRQSPGHGLGLAFVSAVVRAHRGSATISRHPGGGAIVTLSLPLGVLQPNLAVSS